MFERKILKDKFASSILINISIILNSKRLKCYSINGGPVVYMTTVQCHADTPSPPQKNKKIKPL
jgi:hypothetical protein